MRRIQDATGVTDVEEVVQRFLVQGKTQAHLERLQVDNQAQLETLREDRARVTKEFETLKYSGEARNTSNQRMLTEFEEHLTAALQRRDALQAEDAGASRLLVDVVAGVDHLYDKVEGLKPVQFRAAATLADKLREVELRLGKLSTELESRKAELAAIGEDVEVPTTMLLPEFNTRIALVDPAAEAADADESESDADDEVMSRDQMKRAAQSLVDAKTKKGGARRKKRR